MSERNDEIGPVEAMISAMLDDFGRQVASYQSELLRTSNPDMDCLIEAGQLKLKILAEIRVLERRDR